MVITTHAAQRIRKRMGVNKRAVYRVARMALEHGATHGEVTGAMKGYLDRQAIVYGRKLKWRVYSNHLFVFSMEDVLITVMPLGRMMKKGVRSVDKRRMRQGETDG